MVEVSFRRLGTSYCVDSARVRNRTLHYQVLVSMTTSHRTFNGFYVGDKVELPDDKSKTFIEEIVVQQISFYSSYRDDEWHQASAVRLRGHIGVFLDCDLTRVE